jgi:hypothetical protein
MDGIVRETLSWGIDVNVLILALRLGLCVVIAETFNRWFKSLWS